MRAQDVWYGSGLAARALRALLTPFSWLYAAGWKSYEAMYALGLKRAYRPSVVSLCVGNLTAGGSGKTPVTIHLVNALRRLGATVVVSCSGYRGASESGASLAPEGPLSAGQWGDEAALLRDLLSETPLIVGRDRVQAAQIAEREFPDAVLVLDDGFQHLRLQASKYLVLHDPAGKNSRCLPAGPFREPRSGLKRADLVLPGKFRVSEEPLRYVMGSTGTPLTPKSGQRVAVLCAIGSPERFVAALEAAGIEIAQKRLLPDHDPLDGGNLLRSFDPGLAIVVTAKDWVKLKSRPDVQQHQFWVAQQSVAIEPAGSFAEWLRSALASGI